MYKVFLLVLLSTQLFAQSIGVGIIAKDTSLYLVPKIGYSYKFKNDIVVATEVNYFRSKTTKSVVDINGMTGKENINQHNILIPLLVGINYNGLELKSGIYTHNFTDNGLCASINFISKLTKKTKLDYGLTGYFGKLKAINISLSWRIG